MAEPLPGFVVNDLVLRGTQAGLLAGLLLSLPEPTRELAYGRIARRWGNNVAEACRQLVDDELVLRERSDG